MNLIHFTFVAAVQRVLLVVLALVWSAPLMALEVTLSCDRGIPMHAFAADEIRTAVVAANGTFREVPLAAHASTGVTGVRVILAQVGNPLTGWNPLPTPAVSQAYGIRVRVVGALREILVMGNDGKGTLYGGLDVAEAVSMGTVAAMVAGDHAPYVAERGIKFNIPLDARTPSYSDISDAAQASISEVWDMAFWQEYLDEMARQRLTTLSLWNQHPFPSLVTVPEFPAAALADVVRTKVPFEQVSTRGQGIWNAATMGGAANLAVVKKMTPAEKTAFWNHVLELAEARGIAVYLFTWNIFTDGLEGNPYGIVDDSKSASEKQGSAVTKQYFRASVRALLTNLPKLAGIGITGGEEMSGYGLDKETWLADTYGEGMNDVRVGYTATAPSGATTAVAPNATRRLHLIHRLHEVSYEEIEAKFGKFKNNLTIDTSHKYSVAHTYSTTKPTFKLSTIDKAKDSDDQVWLTVRFDDQYNARWGDPAFVRSWVNNLPKQTNRQGEKLLRGFYMGPDGYTWARRANAKGPLNNQVEIKRWWYTQNLFSRLSYDPTISDAYFLNLLAARLKISQGTATALSTGLAHASRITPWLLRYHWVNGNDFEYFPEGCRSLSGFLNVNDYMDNDPIGSGDGNGQSPLTLRAFCEAVRRGETPIDMGSRVEKEANDALSAIAALSEDATKPELNQTLADIRITAAMGKYYAAKFRGARDLMFANLDSANAATHRANAVTQLTDALAKWKTFAGLMAQSYHPMFYCRVSVVDHMAFTAYAANDIARAQGLTTGGPSVATQPALVSQSGATATFRVRGSSTSDSEAQLQYFWYLDGTRPAPVTYSANYSNAAKDVTVTFSKPGRYVFRVLILDSRNRVTRTNNLKIEYTANVNEMNAAPTVYAGLDRGITLPSSLALVGVASDDGLPTSASLSTMWSTVSGPGQVTFTAPTAKSTSATFATAGIYVLRLTANDGALSAHDDLTVTVAAGGGVNRAPTVGAGADASITLPAAATLTGTVSDDGLPTAGTVTSSWTKVSGPGTVTFANASTPGTTATFSVAGTYVLRLSASDTLLSASDEVKIEVKADTAPFVTFTLINADSDQPIAAFDPLVSGAELNLAQLPSRNLAIRGNVRSAVGSMRMVLSGTQTRTQTESTAPYSLFGGTGNDYAAWTPAAGSYGLVGNAYSGAAASGTVLGTASITFTVVDVSNPVNVAPTVSAGPDVSITLPASANLNGTVTDDGLPTASRTQTWTKVSGPGTVTFANATAVDTTASFSAAGTYVLRLTASDGMLSAQDDVTVSVGSGSTAVPPTPASPRVTGNGTANPTLSGVTVPGATVAILVNGVQVGTVIAAGDGSWSYPLTGLPAGAHVITVTAGNSGGTSSASSPVNVTVAGSGGGGGSSSAGGGGGKSCGLGAVAASLLLALMAWVLRHPW